MSPSPRKIQAVVFDLDDTLYAERDFVRSGYRAVDSNGQVDGRIISENEIENCYTHTGETIVASCAVLTRQ